MGAGTNNVFCGPALLKYLPKLKPLILTNPLLKPLRRIKVSAGVSFIFNTPRTNVGEVILFLGAFLNLRLLSSSSIGRQYIFQPK